MAEGLVLWASHVFKEPGSFSLSSHQHIDLVLGLNYSWSAPGIISLYKTLETNNKGHFSWRISVNSRPRRFPFDTTDRHEIICPSPSCKEGSRNKYLVWPAFRTGSSQSCVDNQQRSDPLTHPDLPRTFLILKQKVPHSGKPLSSVQTDGWPPMCYTVHVWCGAGEQQVARTWP